VNWLYMAQDRDVSLRASELLAFEDGLFSKELVLRCSAAADGRFCLSGVLPLFQIYVKGKAIPLQALTGP
jgi:hypothetical protein